jgi:E3 ubiquitin-protein ligase DOA10
MSGGEHDTNICRFCLDSGKTEKNPLISPCSCKGSVEFIHLICLNKWRTQNPERNRETCNLCSGTYRIPSFYDIEKMPGGSITCYLLDSSFVVSIIMNYIGIIFYLASSNIVAIKEGICFIQLIHHGFQLYFMYILFNVRKREEYFQYWINEKRYLLVPLHGVILSITVYQNPILGLVTSSLITNVYWMNHIEVLHLMNRNLENQTE